MKKKVIYNSAIGQQGQGRAEEEEDAHESPNPAHEHHR